MGVKDKLPVLEYGAGTLLREFRSNGLLAVETKDVVYLNKVELPAHSVFLVGDHVNSTETWSGKRYPARSWAPGDVAFLPARSDLKSVADRPYKEIILSMEARLLIETARSYIDRSDIDLRFADITSEYLTGILKVLHQLVVSGESENWPLLTDSLALAATAGVVRQFAPHAAALVDAKRTSLSYERKRRAVEFVEENIDKPIRLQDMAAASSLSQFHFSRAFKATMGVSPSRYVLKRRLRAAMVMLKGSKSLAQIAVDCGFASQSHFSGAFKAELGVTPLQYRKGLVGAVLTWLSVRVLTWAEPLTTVVKMA